MIDYTQQQQKQPQQPGQAPAQSPAQNPAPSAMGQPPALGVPQGGAPRPASPMAPAGQAPQSNARMGGIIGSPTPQAQPWAQATQQQAETQQNQQQTPRSYYGEQPQPIGAGDSLSAAPDYSAMQSDWQQQAQVPEAPQPIQAQQSSAAPGMQRKQQQRSYYGEL